jgi:DNA-binding NarL/FixJ family response regulator
VVDDEWLSHGGLVKLVEGRDDEVVGQSCDGFEALEQARALRPDVALPKRAQARARNNNQRS